MKLSFPPTGIFTFKNYITLDAIDYLKKRYPDKLDKIDFVSFGNLPLLKYLDHKPLASIDECSYEMGEAAARLLFEMINEEIDSPKEKPKKIEIPCRLVVHK
jgi:LacI family transcriptional regulator